VLTEIVDDCPKEDKRTDTFLLLRRSGMGRQIIAAIVASQIKVQFYDVNTECGPEAGGCTIGKRVLVEASARINAVDRQGILAHEVGHVMMNMSGYPLSHKVFSREEMFAYAFGWNYLLTLTPEEWRQSMFARPYLELYRSNPLAALGLFCWEKWLQANSDKPGFSC
jgi:hypothetical protein